MDTFNFDEWARLAQDNPEEFERQRKIAIETVIASAPGRLQEGLRRLQWRVDMERQRCRTPFQAALKLHQMLMGHLLGEYGLVKALLDFDEAMTGRPHDFMPIFAPRETKVLPFHPRAVSPTA